MRRWSSAAILTSTTTKWRLRFLFLSFHCRFLSFLREFLSFHRWLSVFRLFSNQRFKQLLLNSIRNSNFIRHSRRVNVRFPQTPLTRFLQIYANVCKFLQIRGRYRCAGMLARGKRRYANEQSPETNLASPLAANIWLVGRLFDLFKLNIFKLIWLDDFEVDL